MNNVLIIAVVCIPLLLGCKNADAKRSPALPDAVGHAQNPGQSRDPDYFGLIEEYRTMLKEDPHDLAVIIALGNSYYSSRPWSDAIRLNEQALRIDPRNADVDTNMGNACRNVGRPDRALFAYRLALNNDPGHVDARYHMGLVYAFDFKQYDTAIHLWEDLLRLSPNYPHAGDIRAFMGAFRKALRKGGS